MPCMLDTVILAQLVTLALLQTMEQSRRQHIEHKQYSNENDSSRDDSYTYILFLNFLISLYLSLLPDPSPLMNTYNSSHKPHNYKMKHQCATGSSYSFTEEKAGPTHIKFHTSLLVLMALILYEMNIAMYFIILYYHVVQFD